MKLSKFIEQLVELEKVGHGDKEVYYSHGSSGDCGPLENARVTNDLDPSTGPFDLEDGEYFIKIYAGY